MDAVLNVLQNYNKMIAGGAAVLTVLVLIILLARILKHVKRLNKSLNSITENVQAYVDVILSEDAEEAETEQLQTAEQYRQSAGERGIKSAEQQKKEEEEKIVNAVLQEYFT